MAADLPSTPTHASEEIGFAIDRPTTPQQRAAPGVTPISKAIALLQHRSSMTPSSASGRTSRTAELSARKAELATLLNQVNTAYPHKKVIIACAHSMILFSASCMLHETHVA